MEIKKILIGTEAAQFLPFAESRCRFFASAFQGFYISRTIKAVDATIMVEIYSKDKGIVTIWAYGGGYEFFCSGPTATFASVEDTALKALRGSAVKVFLTKDASGTVKAKSTPKGSTLLPSSGRTGWGYSPDVLDMHYKYLDRQGWQIQGISERVDFLKSDGDKALMSAWCAASATENINRKSGSLYEGYAARDIFYDAAPTKIATGEGKGAISVPDADWYRRASLCVVENEQFGNREFYVMTTISGDLVVYTPRPRNLNMDYVPLYEEQQIKTNVENTYAKTISIPLPTNVRKPVGKARDTVPPNYSDDDLQKELDNFPQYVWKFNEGCTKMAGIVYFEAEPTYFQGKPLKNSFGEIIREALPSILEFNLSIKITGSNLEDFSVSLTESRNMNPFTTDRVFLECDYSWKIKDDEAVEKNDLIAIESKVYKFYAEPVTQADWENETPPFGVPSWYDLLAKDYPTGNAIGAMDTQADTIITNITKGTNLHTFCTMRPNIMADRSDNVIYHDSATIIAVDLRILAWVIQKDLIEATSEGEGAMDIINLYGGAYGPSYYYNKIERATKLETWAYNKVQKEQYLSTNEGLNEKLDLRANGIGLQDIQDRAKFVLVPPSTRGFPYKGDAGASLNPAFFAFPYNEIPEPQYEHEYDFSSFSDWVTQSAPAIVWDLFFPNRAEQVLTSGRFGSTNRLEYTELPLALYEALSTMVFPEPPGVVQGIYDLPTGAYFYIQVGLPAVSVLTNDGFAVHPDGHWSVTTTHTISYDGPTRVERTKRVQPSTGETLEVKFIVPEGYVNAFFPIDKSKFVYENVDIISIKGKEDEVVTSHLEMYNKAFEKEHTQDEFATKPKFRTSGWTFKNFVSYVLGGPFGNSKLYTVEGVRRFSVDYLEFVGSEYSIYARYSGLRTSSEYDRAKGFTIGPGVRRPVCAALFDIRPSLLLSRFGPYLERVKRDGVEAENLNAELVPSPGPIGGNGITSGKLFRNGANQPNSKLITFINEAKVGGSRLFYGTLRFTEKIEEKEQP